MGDIVNLNRARKAKGKADAKARAAANSVAFGRTKTERLADEVEKTRRERALDGAKRET